MFSSQKSVFAVVVGLLSIVLFGASSAHADALASTWSKGFHSKVRLTAATLLGDGDGTALYAGVDIRMDKNWKTYWKIPGDGGGIPPEFNWSRSQNVKAVQVMYPLPKVMKDIDGYSLGYKDAVLFPVSVTPVNPARPVKLRLDVYYGVCEEICIPAEASLALDVGPQARAPIAVQRDIMSALSKVPVKAPDNVRVSQKILKLAGGKPHAHVAVSVPVTQGTASGASAVKLFAVSRRGDYLPIPRMVGDDGEGGSMFEIDFKHVDKPDELAGETIDLVIASDGHGVTVPWTIAAP